MGGGAIASIPLALTSCGKGGDDKDHKRDPIQEQDIKISDISSFYNNLEKKYVHNDKYDFNYISIDNGNTESLILRNEQKWKAMKKYFSDIKNFSCIEIMMGFLYYYAVMGSDTGNSQRNIVGDETVYDSIQIQANEDYALMRNFNSTDKKGTIKDAYKAEKISDGCFDVVGASAFGSEENNRLDFDTDVDAVSMAVGGVKPKNNKYKSGESINMIVFLDLTNPLSVVAVPETLYPSCSFFSPQI